MIDVVINLRVSEDVIIKRLSARRVCPMCNPIYHLINMSPKVNGICDICGAALIQREDDKPDVIKRRLRVYEEESSSILEYYRGKELVVDVDGNGAVDEVSARMKKAVEGLKALKRP